jgi:hypothetical protein
MSSTKFLHLAVNARTMLIPTSLLECVGIKEARVPDPNCRVINKSCSTMANFADSELLLHVHGVVSSSLVENWSVLSDSIVRVGFEHHFWDPGAPEDSQFIGFADFNPTHHPELSIDEFEYRFWDPGLTQASMHIVLATSCVDVGPNYFHWLVLIY